VQADEERRRLAAAYGLPGASGPSRRCARDVAADPRRADLEKAQRPALGRLRADRLEEDVDADDAGAQERLGVQDRAVDMGLGGDVDDGVGLGHQRPDDRRIRDVADDEGEPSCLLGSSRPRRGSPAAGVGELAEDRIRPVTAG
jgi:hypothetical protein